AELLLAPADEILRHRLVAEAGGILEHRIEQRAGRRAAIGLDHRFRGEEREAVAQPLRIAGDHADAALELTRRGAPIGALGGERAAPHGDLRLLVEGSEIELLAGTIALLGKE